MIGMQSIRDRMETVTAKISSATILQIDIGNQVQKLTDSLILWLSLGFWAAKTSISDKKISDVFNHLHHVTYGCMVARCQASVAPPQELCNIQLPKVQHIFQRVPGIAGICNCSKHQESLEVALHSCELT